MGSSNLQCAISKETIVPTDETVTLIIEPVPENDREMKSLYKTASDIGELFKINSLPIKGTYEDYGRSIALDSDSVEIELCKQFYGYDYSSDMGDDWGASGYRLKRGEPVRSYYDTNTVEFVVLKDVYDMLVSNTNNTHISALVKERKFKEAFGGAIDEQLLSVINGVQSDAVIVEAATFLQGLRNLGVRLSHTPGIAGQLGDEDFKMSEEVRSKLTMELNDKKQDLGAPELFCLLTKEAIENDSVVYVAPVLSNSNINRDMGVASYGNHSVKSMFDLITSPIACRYQNKKLTPVQPINGGVRNLLIKTLRQKESINDNEIIDLITKSGELLGMGFFQNEIYTANCVVFSEDAYNALNSEDEIEQLRSRMTSDMDIYVDSLIKLHEITETQYKSVDDFISEIKKSGVFKGENLERALKVIDIYTNEVKSEGRSYRYLLDDLHRFIPGTESDSRFVARNSFYDDVIKEDGNNGIFPYLTVIEINKNLDSVSKNAPSAESYAHTLKVNCHEILSTALENCKLLRNLSKAAIVLYPSDIYSGDLNISEQRALMRKINLYSYQRCLEKIKEYEE